MITSSVTSTDTTQTQTTATSENEAASTAASDFDTFLQLLTTQLKNQDPLAPLDSTQFVEQLASFSAVEQQIQTNERLEELTASLSASNLEAASTWIGRTVEVRSGAASFNGEELSYIIPQSSLGDATEAVIQNLNGDVLYSETIAAGQVEFTWDGRNAKGETLANGDYVVTINYSDGDEVTDTQFPIALAEVNEARLIDGEAKLVLVNGAVINAEDVIAVRNNGLVDDEATE